MDKRDKIDQKLADRFQNVEMKPDAAVWSRIDASLTAANVAVPRRGRIIRLTATVASAAALLLLSLLLFQQNDVAIKSPNLPKEIVQTVPTLEENTPIKNQVVETEDIVAYAAQPKVETSRKSRMSVQRAPVATNEPNTIQPNEEKSEAVVTKSIAKSQSNNTMVEREPIEKRIKRRKKEVKINVSGSANFISSVSGSGNNSLLNPLKALDNNPMNYGNHLTEDREWKHNMPLSFGLTVQKMLTRKIGIETGFVYTYLSSTSDGATLLDQDIKQKLHYIGIPLNVVYSIVAGKRFGLYAKAGVLVDTPISAVGINSFDNKQKSDQLEIKGVQVTSMIQLGGEYTMNHFLSLYVEPTLNYYHKSNQPISFRTENDFAFSAQVGIRFKL